MPGLSQWLRSKLILQFAACRKKGKAEKDRGKGRKKDRSSRKRAATGPLIRRGSASTMATVADADGPATRFESKEWDSAAGKGGDRSPLD